MEMILQRQEATQHSTPGTLSGLGDGNIYQTLEPPAIPDPDYDGCPVCIPAGRFPVLMMMSPKFSAVLGAPTRVPVLQGVPGREHVELHFGNTVEQPGSTRQHPVFLSEGCILVGNSRLNADTILGTRDACLNHVWPAIQSAENRGEEIWITIIDAA